MHDTEIDVAPARCRDAGHGDEHKRLEQDEYVQYLFPCAEPFGEVGALDLQKGGEKVRYCGEHAYLSDGCTQQYREGGKIFLGEAGHGAGEGAVVKRQRQTLFSPVFLFRLSALFRVPPSLSLYCNP